MIRKNKPGRGKKKNRKSFLESVFRDDDSQINDISKYSVIFTIAAVPLCGILYGIKGIIVFILCAILMMLNLGWLKELADILLGNSGERAVKARSFAKFFTLYLLLGLCLYAIIAIWKTDVIPILLGISTLVVGIFCVSMKELFRSNKG